MWVKSRIGSKPTFLFIAGPSTCVGMPETISVRPSGSARATASVPRSPPAADPVLVVELLAEGGRERVGIEPADRIGRAAGRERHHHSHRFARPFRGQRGAGCQCNSGDGGAR